MILPDRKHVCLALPRKPHFGTPIKFFAPDEKHVMSWSFCLGSRYYIMFPIFKMDTNVEITYPGGKKETYRVPMNGGQ